MLYFDLFFLLILGYFIFKFIQVLIKMNEKIIFPLSKEDMLMIRKQPEKPLDPPTFFGQKSSIIIYTILLSFVMIMFLFKMFIESLNWSVYLTLFLLMAQNSSFFNLFVILKDGVLSDDRFIAWDKIKSFKFVRIDINHRYYGFSKKVNDTYELQIKASFSSTNCIVISDEAKEKLEQILTENIFDKNNEECHEQQCEK